MSGSLEDTADIIVDPKAAEHRAGDVLAGRFKVRDIVVNSPYGTMYAAVDLSGGKLVLIETVNSNIPSGLDTFARLAKVFVPVEHPNILKLLSYEEIDAKPFFVWEFVDFVRLEDLIVSGGFIEQESEIFDTVSQICRGLQFAHDQGIAHGYVHPRNICLAEIEGELCVKVANFGFAHMLRQLVTYETAGIVLQPKIENDIYQLSVLTYFLVTGESPDPGRTLDDLLDPRSADKVGFETLADHRSDLKAYEELLQILDDTADPDEDFRVSSAKEFEDGLIDWFESTKSAVIATSSEVAEKVAQEQQSPESSQKKKRKITNNMRTTVKQMVNLKSKQSSQEETAVMKLTNIAAAKGPRQSPMNSVIRLSVTLVVVLLITGVAIYATFIKPREFKDGWVQVSSKLANVVSPNKQDDEVSIEPISIPAISNAPQVVQSGDKPALVSMEVSKPKTRMPAFNPSVLRDLYREDYVPTDNQKRRGFRIEYSEFNPDWIK